MGFFSFIKNLGKKTSYLDKPSIASKNSLPTIPFDQKIFDCYELVFQKIIADVDGISEDGKARTLEVVKECHGYVLDKHHSFKSLYNDFFAHQEWSWGEYKKWDEFFDELGKRPARLPRWHAVRNKRPDNSILLAKLTKDDILSICQDLGIQASPSRKKAELAALLLPVSSLKHHPIAVSELEDMKAKENWLIYGHLIRTIISRGLDLYNYERAIDAGFKKFSFLHGNDDEVEFFELAIEAAPNSLLPVYPSSLTMRRPVRSGKD